MGYRISYDTSGDVKKVRYWEKYMSRICKVFLIGAALFVLLWAESADFTATLHAFEVMAMELGQGSGFKEAFSEFCLDVLEGAEIG